MGKLLFAFTVFWAYIAFSQYFLIWYANILRKLASDFIRNTEGWRRLEHLPSSSVTSSLRSLLLLVAATQEEPCRYLRQLPSGSS